MGAARLLNAEDYAREWLARLRERNSRPYSKRAAKHWDRARRGGGQVDESITDEALRLLFSEYGDRCVYCGAAGYLEIDHFIPLSRGGHHELSNFVPACIACNRDKGALHPSAFALRIDPGRIHPKVAARLAGSTRGS